MPGSTVKPAGPENERVSWVPEPPPNSLGMVAVFVVLAAALWTFWPKNEPEVGKSAPLPPAKEVRGVEKEPVQPKIIYVYPQKTKAALDLPKDVVADPAKKVMATGKLDAEDRPYTLSAVVDTETGDSQVYARPDPLPWIGPGRRGAVGLAYGLSDQGPTGKIYAEHDLLRIKALHAGARAEVDQYGRWFTGGYVEYRF